MFETAMRERERVMGCRKSSYLRKILSLKIWRMSFHSIVFILISQKRLILFHALIYALVYKKGAYMEKL